MVTNAVPLLRTLVRICVGPINPRRDVVVRISFDWRCNNDAKYNAIENGKESERGRWS